LHLNAEPPAKNKEEYIAKQLQTTIFITEGDSASGSITKSRDVETQAVFSLRGKPLNCFGLTKKIVYENEEFNLLQHALNIEEFFLQFFPDLVKSGHLYVLQTPLFRVRNKKETIYCYSEEERVNAIKKLGAKPEITRFKGLGEISPEEFKFFIGDNIRLEPVVINKDVHIKDILEYFMGKNTPERQEFIINNLRVEKDEVVATKETELETEETE